MSPINPNFKPGVGHLVTDRFDFQHHVDGTAFRHVAGSIDLSPPVLIGSTSITDVQTAIAALAGTIIVPSVPDATTTSKGIIQLGGDLFGLNTTALNPKVSGLQGTPVGTFSGLTNGQVLTWNGTFWTNTAVPGSITLTRDLGGTTSSPLVVGIQGRNVSSTAPTTGQALAWNGTAWAPAGIPSTPSGTGFATLTSGTYDATATPNIRYTTQLQTDVDIQYKNGAIFGNLHWVPTSVTKTLTLPDATDTLVGQGTTDTLTNKTINATNNTITDTGTLSGDLLVSNGTKFTRLAKGVNGTFLGVSGGVLGYFTPSGSTPTGTGFATVTGGVFDAAATGNIRYTGGKLQTSVNIQFLNGAITGDLAWGPTVSNKTLTLPNASDTLVGQNTTDTLANKTINATSNTITDTSTLTGDLLKSNGTKFVRFPMGTALQVLRVNAGGTDLEFAAPSSGGSSSGAVNTVQTSNGSGGFLGATNVLANTNFISIGVTPSGTGFLRVPNGTGDTILGAKDNSAVDVNVISRPATNSFLFGNQTNQADVTLAGATTNIQASSIVKVFAPSDLTNAAITVTGNGTVTMNPHAQTGFQIGTNVNANGAIIQLWNGVTGFAAGDSRFIGFGNSAAPPTGTPSGGGYLWVDTGALKYKGSSGTQTTVGPADPHCKKCGRDFMHEWQNDNYGKLATCVPCLLDALQVIGIDVDAFSDRNLV